MQLSNVEVTNIMSPLFVMLYSGKSHSYFTVFFHENYREYIKIFSEYFSKYFQTALTFIY